MKSKFIIFLILTLGLLTNCHKDNFDPGVIIDPPPPGEVHIIKDVSGRVQDIMGEAVIPDKLSVYNNPLSFDEESFFNFKTSINTNSLQLHATKRGYYDALISEPVAEKGFDYYELILLQLKEVKNYPASLPINYSNGNLEIAFPPAAFKNNKGEIYSGTVSISATLVDPGDQISYQYFPFMGKVAKTENTYYRLKQLNGAIIEAFADNGEKLGLVKPAKISMPITNTFKDGSPQCRSWYYDISNMCWKESGLCNFNNAKYQFETNNLGFQSIAIPFIPKEITATIQSGNFGSIRSIKIIQRNEFFVSILRPNASATYHCFIPNTDAVECYIIDNCGVTLYENKTILPSQAIISDARIHTISGELVDCSGNPISNGYVSLKDENNSDFKIIKANKQGLFNAIMDVCQLDQIQIFAADQSTGIKGLSYYFENTSKINIGQIKVCNAAPVTNKIILQVDDQIRIITDKIKITKDPNFQILHVNFTDNTSSSGTVDYSFDLNKTGAAEKYDFSGFINSMKNGNPDLVLTSIDCPNVKIQRWGINPGEAIEATIRNCKIVVFPETDTQGKHKGTIRIEGKIDM